MFRRIMVPLGIGMFVSCALAASPTPQVEHLRIKHEKFRLDNGLTVLVHEDHSVPLVAVNLWYHVGSRDERPGRTGFAHLFEHFFFNGSEHYPHGFREAMDDLGANNRNGTTSNDRTNFFEDVPLSGLERTLYLEADRMGFLAGNLSEEMLERERGVVKNEKLQGENQPYGRVFGRIAETIYPAGHPYSWTPIGSIEDIDAASLGDVKDWYAAYYGPGNAVLVLAGDITVARARELVEKYFAGIAPGPPISRLRQWVPELASNIRDSMQDRVPQQRIYRIWHLPPVTDPVTYDIELFADALAGSESAPLDRRLVFESQLATDVSAFVWGKELTSTLIVQMSIRPGADAASAERELDQVIADQLKQGIGETTLARSRTRMLARFARGMERLGGMGGRSDVLAESETFHGDSNAYLDRLQHLANANPDRVLKAARVWLGKSHYTMSVEPMPQLSASTSDLDRSVLPELGDTPDLKFPTIQRATLDNGLQVLLMQRDSVPLVQLALNIDAGSASDPQAAAGTSTLALEMLLKGTQTRDAFAIVDERDALGAVLGTSNGQDLSTIYLNVPRDSLSKALPLLADVSRNPAFPDAMLEIQRKQQLTSIRQQKASPSGAALRILPGLLYGAGHAYGQPVGGLGDEESVARLTRADLQNWHRAWFLPNNTSLVVAGNITMAELLPMLRNSLGRWPRADAPQKRLGSAAPSAVGTVYLIDKPGAPQSVIVAGHLAPAPGKDSDLALDTAIRNFGGMATSRLNRNLRLEKHWSYGTQGLITASRGTRAFVVVAPVQTDRTSESIEEVRKEIRGLAGARPLAGAEFDSIKRSQVARLAGRFETLASLVDAATDVVNTGRDPDYYYGHAQALRALSAEQINAAAAAAIQPDQLSWIVIGDLKRVETAIRALDLGKIVRIDADGKVLANP